MKANVTLELSISRRKTSDLPELVHVMQLENALLQIPSTSSGIKVDIVSKEIMANREYEIGKTKTWGYKGALRIRKGRLFTPIC